MGANTLGIDASESNIAIASLHASADPRLDPSSKSSRLSYLNAPAEGLLSSGKKYDIVCSMEVVEHVDNPAAFLATCAELVKVQTHSILACGIFFNGRISSPVDIFSCQQYQGHLSHMHLPFSWQKTSYAKFQKVHTPIRNT